MARLIKREYTRDPVIPDSYFVGQKGNKYVYKDKYSDYYYVLYRSQGMWAVETWSGGCKC